MRLLFAAIIMLAAPFAWAGEPSLDDALEGFGNTPEIEGTEVVREEGPLELDGSVSAGAAWSYNRDAPAPGEPDYGGLSRLRLRASLKATLELSKHWKAVAEGHGFYDASYLIRGRDKHTAEVLDEMESGVELGEAYVQGRLTERADLTLGRQIVVWGRSESFRVTDVINPMDLREPGMVDIEDMRLPVAALRVDVYAGRWTASPIVIGEVYLDRPPPTGSDYSPVSMVLPPELVPDGPEYGLAVTGILRGWDISFYGAEYYDDAFYLNAGVREHARITMFGAAAGIVRGDWLFFGEAARHSGLRFTNASGSKTRDSLLVGLEYAGFTDTSITVDTVLYRINDFEPLMEALPDLAREDTFAWSLRFRRDFMRQTLHMMLLSVFYGPDGGLGGMGRLQFEYDMSDSVGITAGIVDYREGDDARLGALGDRDRVFAEIKYSY